VICDCPQHFRSIHHVVIIAGRVVRYDECCPLSKVLELVERFQGGVVIDRLVRPKLPCQPRILFDHMLGTSSYCAIVESSQNLVNAAFLN